MLSDKWSPKAQQKRGRPPFGSITGDHASVLITWMDGSAPASQGDEDPANIYRSFNLYRS